jgi:NADP-dependent 3-hydroxy acid dehydrogenase YdfG
LQLSQVQVQELGKRLAIELAKKRMLNLILSDKNADGLRQNTKSFGTNNWCYLQNTYRSRCIRRKGKSTDLLRRRIERKHEYIDLLFNNAGFAFGKISLKKVKMDDFHRKLWM